MKILLPIDGSKSSVNATKQVVKLAKNSCSPVKVTLIGVYDDAGKYVDEYLRNACAKELKGAQKVLDIAKIKYSTEIKSGHIAKEIITLASKEKVDLIVMGAKGRGGFLDVLMGSIAQRVASSAKQPVLLVK